MTLVPPNALAEMRELQKTSALTASLAGQFFETDAYRKFRSRVFYVLERREARLKAGLTEQRGAALIGPAGFGKTRLAEEVITEYSALATATGGREFGTEILSVLVPGQATVKGTCNKILKALGYPQNPARSEDYLAERVMYYLKELRYAGLHLDEVQDAGRHKTSDGMKLFAKRFRNMMQENEWPVCLILTGTLEAKQFINCDQTLTRRLKPVEVRPVTFEGEGAILNAAITGFFKKAGLSDGGLLLEREFWQILIHAAAMRFGLVIDMSIEAIECALRADDQTISMAHFAEAYGDQTDCDDELNPFISASWKSIDPTIAMDRWVEERKKRKTKK